MRDCDILIAGAGPVGLTAALALRALGRPVTVLEAGAPHGVHPGSRAIFLHKYTLEILDRVRPGLGYELARRGLTWTTKRTLYRGREIYRRTYPAPRHDALPAATNLPQGETERLLEQACAAAGVEVIWNAEAVRAASDGRAVVIETAGGETFRAGYVLAADGARSTIRESVGLRLEGPRTSHAFVIVDTAEDPDDPLPLERIFHYEHPAVGLRNVLFVPFAGHWRVDLQCQETDDPDAFSGSDGIRRWLPLVMPAKYSDRVTWVSSYVFRQAIANAFTDASRRILLVGEAAHVFAPFGARGLNSGVPDALVAAQAIDAALRAASAEDAARNIDGFAESRRAAAVRNRAASSTALAHMLARTPLRRATRRLAALLAPVVPALAKWMDSAPYGPPLEHADRHGMHY